MWPFTKKKKKRCENFWHRQSPANVGGSPACPECGGTVGYVQATVHRQRRRDDDDNYAGAVMGATVGGSIGGFAGAGVGSVIGREIASEQRDDPPAFQGFEGGQSGGAGASGTFDAPDPSPSIPDPGPACDSSPAVDSSPADTSSCDTSSSCCDT